MGHHLDDCTIYAVDFDGTLCENRFPDIGMPNTKLIEWLIQKKAEGDKLILWTNRMGQYLDNAVKWCADQGLEFDTVNKNLPEIMKRYEKILNGQPASPKITADIFIDDAACSTGLPFGRPGCPLGGCWNASCSRTGFEKKITGKP